MQSYYDYWLVTLSVILAFFASFAALSLASRIPYVKKEKIPHWLIGGSFAMGTGIWSMHFIGMLAYHLPIKISYDPAITVFSVFIAVLASGTALFIMKKGEGSKPRLYLSSLVMGIGISGMHYSGMAAMKMQPPISYNPYLVFISVAIAVTASLFALRFSFFQMPSVILITSRNLSASVFLGAAISGMHYSGMAAADFDPGSVCTAAETGLNPFTMAAIITLISILIILTAILIVFFEIKMAEQNASMVSTLTLHNKELQAKAEELATAMTESIRKNAEIDRMLASIVKQADEGIIVTDKNGNITLWSDAAEKIFGYNTQEILGSSLSKLNALRHDRSCDMALSHDDELDKYLLYQTKWGNFVYISAYKSELRDEQNHVIGEIHMLRDISEQRDYHQRMIRTKAVFQHLGEAVIITDEHNKIISINEAFTKITGYQQKEVYGKNPNLLSSGKHSEDFYNAMWNELQAKGIWKGEIWNKRKNGSVFPEWLTITTLLGSENKICNYIAIFSDISAYKEKEQHIEFLAYHDNLTGLPNRSLMEDRLMQALAHADRISKKAAVLFIDLDRFKFINDTLGHSMGDKLLKEAAKRILSVVRQDDTVARQGGDEFIVVLQEINSAVDAANVAQKIINIISRNYEIEGETLSITPSIGISIYPDDGMEFEDLIKNSDAAMYHAKEQGRSNYQFFTEHLNKKIQEKLHLEKELIQACKNNELSIVFQPQYLLKNKTLVGAEILLRWKHPEMGEIPPEKFIPIAEESGLIETVGEWVLDTTLKLLSEKISESPFLQEISYSINISPRQLQNPLFVERLKFIIDRYGFPAHLLELEITETAIMMDLQKSYDILLKLKDLKVKISIDDFGTGYSSLSYLKRLPIDRLKIDRSFIRDIPENSNDSSIVLAIINLSHTLGLTVVAEGVEKTDQEEFLIQSRCNIAQGYLYSRPVTPENFFKMTESL